MSFKDTRLETPEVTHGDVPSGIHAGFPTPESPKSRNLSLSWISTLDSPPVLGAKARWRFSSRGNPSTKNWPLGSYLRGEWSTLLSVTLFYGLEVDHYSPLRGFFMKPNPRGKFSWLAVGLQDLELRDEWFVLEYTLVNQKISRWWRLTVYSRIILWVQPPVKELPTFPFPSLLLGCNRQAKIYSLSDGYFPRVEWKERECCLESQEIIWRLHFINSYILEWINIKCSNLQYNF